MGGFNSNTRLRSLSVVPPDKIRDPKFQYGMEIIFLTARIEEIAISAAQYNTRKNYLMLEAALHTLHQLVHPLASKKYYIKFKLLMKKLHASRHLLNNKETRFEYFLILNAWFGYLIEQYRYYGIIPPRNATVLAGYGVIEEDENEEEIEDAEASLLPTANDTQ